MSETTTPKPPSRWALSVEETAAVPGVSRAHAYRMVRAGVIPSVRVGDRVIVPIDRLRAEVVNQGRAEWTTSAKVQDRPE